jgi:hypothetical protein
VGKTSTRRCNVTSAYPDEPGIDPDKTEESPLPDRGDDDRHGIEEGDDGAATADYDP